MNQYMCPVISVDAAHLKSVYKGILFIYSGLTGNDEACISVFGVSGGNEDYKNLEYVQYIACQSLSINVNCGRWSYIFQVCVHL